ncbi:DUF308 domain-containing protein [Streptomyces sp. NPDC047071]|uniref:HdeD family acid-resistance protein n=1 Tax=Streptomyces sp. NPDC047071 TaxID=3154808 RepID=UPI003452CE9B
MEHIGEVGRPHRGGAGNPLERLGKVAWQALMLMGFAAIAIGVVALVWPGRTLLVLGVLFGIYLLISGVMEIVAAFGAFVSAGMRVLLVVTGALSITLGVLCFRNSLHNSVLLLSLWIGIGFLMYGIATAVTAAEMHSGWGVFLGLLAAAGGIIVLSWPIGSIVTLAVFTGIWLIAVGLTEVIHAFTLRSLVRSAGGSRRHATAVA